MILVLLGTQPQQFLRLVQMIDQISQENFPEEEFIVQIGKTNYQFTNPKIKSFNYLPEYEQKIKEAKFLITHGGVGSIMDGLKYQKKIIVCPRRKKYQEHVDDHQLEISEKFANLNYIKLINLKKELKEYMLNINNINFNFYKSENQEFNQKLNKYLKKN